MQITLKIPDDVITKNFLLALLQQDYKETVIPEILNFFGDRGLEFLEIFAGLTFELPPSKTIEEYVRDIRFYKEYMAIERRETTKIDKKNLYLELREEYQIDSFEAKKIIDKMKKIEGQKKCQPH